ncbi:hypothetical protein CSA56_15555 [candidate division KSB3 bacterium]|uniref:Uncharacterized protein n=1 Tax=candidate division KSB3 bacterium TaxID=2044937 RepID=A0A2G6K9T4_9BACT|nr:MAG: hypothetical protein CSA56_15555 [candidate division KSB3 bacterium]
MLIPETFLSMPKPAKNSFSGSMDAHKKRSISLKKLLLIVFMRLFSNRGPLSSLLTASFQAEEKIEFFHNIAYLLKICIVANIFYLTKPFGLH